MPNESIFNSYDMVVSITQKTINDQLLSLVDAGLITNRFIAWRKTEESSGDFTFGVVKKLADIPQGVPGQSIVEYLDTTYTPSVAITNTGTVIAFDMNFDTGTAYFNNGFGTLKKHDTKAWIYSVNVQLGFNVLAENDLKGGKKIPENVKQQLQDFMDADFSISHLFMDFESTDLLTPNTNTRAGGAGDIGTKVLVEFMAEFLTYQQKSGNPYLLGYSPVSTDSTKIAPASQVPAVLRPVGTTYAMYYDAANPELSNLNFLLVTKGGHGTIPSNPAVLDGNWFTKGSKEGGKMIYSHAALVEPLVTIPLYQQLQSQVYDQIHNIIDTSPGNAYAAGKTQVSDGYAFTIQHDDGHRNKYFNSFNMTTAASPGQVNLNFSGHMHFWKEKSKKMPLCRAHASATQNVDWSGTTSLRVGKNKQDKPSLIMDTSTNPTSDSHHTHKDKCAKYWEEIDKILKALLKGFSFAVPIPNNLLASGNSWDIPGFGSVGVALHNLGNTVATTVVLPAGDEFFFQHPSLDAEQNMSISLAYKSQS